MSIFKRGSVYWYKFMWNGKVIRESTRQGNDKTARNRESTHRARLSKQHDAREDAGDAHFLQRIVPCYLDQAPHTNPYAGTVPRVRFQALC
jgi:hypothetical protein